MAYTLIGSERSPFVRICRMLMKQHEIDFHFRILNFLDDKMAATSLEKESPINKVPILIDGEQKIFDSRVIVRYLIKKHDLPEPTIDEENIISAIYGCLDAGVSLFLLKRDGVDILLPAFQRTQHRIPACLKFVEPWARTLDPKNPRHWNYASMSLYSYLYWDRMRAKMADLKSHPALEKFILDFADAPGVQDTSFSQ